MAAIEIAISSVVADGYLGYTYTTDYIAAKDATTANYINIDAGTIGVGWGSAPALFRGYLYFNTSTDNIPVNAIIQSATLELYVPLSCPAVISGGMDVSLFSGQTTYPHAALEVGDFDRTFYAAGGANKINVVGADNAWKTFTLNSTGYTWIQLGAGVRTKLCLRSEFDISPTVPKTTEPTGMEVLFYSADHGSLKPTLTITYETNSIITTDAADGLGPTYVTGNGTVDAQGTGSITEYGFIYNNDGTDPVDIASADNKTTSSDLAGGVFSASLTSLTSATSYYYRAYMTTSVGAGYGDAVEFTTSAAADVLAVSTDNADDIEPTTATLNGTIDSDGGDTTTVRGFVYKLGGDPGIPADPSTADNNVEEAAGGATGAFDIGITSLTENSFYMFRAYAESDAPAIAYGGVNGFYTTTAGSDTFDGSTGDGTISMAGYYSSCSVGTAEALGDSLDVSNTYLYTQYHSSYNSELGKYYVNFRRSFLYFDLSGIPADSTILSATLYVYLEDWDRKHPGNAAVYDGQPSYPTTSGLALSDFDKSKYSLIGSLSGSHIVHTWWSRSIPAASIHPGGVTKFMLKSANECATGSYTMIAFSSADGAQEPYLDIEWTAPGTIKTPQINIADTWKDVDSMRINIGDAWKDVEYVLINVGDEWKPLTS